MLNPEKMNKESYKILIKFNGNETDKQRLIRDLKHEKNVIYVLELMGTYNLDLEIEIDNRKRLQELLMRLRDNYSIRDYETISLFYDYGSDFFPIEKK